MNDDDEYLNPEDFFEEAQDFYKKYLRKYMIRSIFKIPKNTTLKL